MVERQWRRRNEGQAIGSCGRSTCRTLFVRLAEDKIVTLPIAYNLTAESCSAIS